MFLSFYYVLAPGIQTLSLWVVMGCKDIFKGVFLKDFIGYLFLVHEIENEG